MEIIQPPTKYWILNSFLMGDPNEITHYCTFSPTVNREKCLSQSETKLCAISCEDIGSSAVWI